MSWELIPESPQNSRAGMPSGGRPMWSLLLVGTIVSLLGIALLIWPFFAASRILALLAGAALIANGLAAIVGTRARALGLPAGILLILVGILALVFPDFTVNVMVSFVAVVMLIIGVIWLLIALRFRGTAGVGFAWIPGLLLLLGLAALIWPAFALTLAAVAAGLVTLFIGGSLVAVAFALRRASRTN